MDLIFEGRAKWVGIARAISPDAHFATNPPAADRYPPALRSLDAALAFAILASLGQQRRSIGTGNPSRELTSTPDRLRSHRLFSL
jgi:hypothetical protein